MNTVLIMMCMVHVLSWSYLALAYQALCSKYGSYAEINRAGKISTPTLEIATVAAEVAS